MFSHGSQELRSVFCCRKLATSGFRACPGNFCQVPFERMLALRVQVSQREHQSRYRKPTRLCLVRCSEVLQGRASSRCLIHLTMTSTRRFTCNDLFHFDGVNLDYFTETYNLPFYLQYLANWPEYCLTTEGPGKEIMGYILGKAEGEGEKWHGHVTAVTVAPEYRRQRLAQKLMNDLEDITEEVHKAYFVDLFVRVTNATAIQMYNKFGYSVYRTVLGYYGGDEDAYDMRKAMSRDKDGKCVIPLTRPIYPHELEHD